MRRIWSYRCKRWRNAGLEILPESALYGEIGLVKLISLIPTIALPYKGTFVKAGYGKTVRPVWAADGGQPSGATSDPTSEKLSNKAPSIVAI